MPEVTFKNGEMLPDSPEDRKAIYDLFCEDEKGNYFIVELQKITQEHFQSRALYYTTFPIQHSFEKAEFLRLSSDDKEQYHKNLKAYRDLVNVEEYAIKRGLEEGLLKIGLDVETIVTSTGLSKKEIESL